ncbi:extracellular solute-binding protein [Paenibacillus alkaliterrae]|uniref:ABC transporter substrate-binding protein n=1 Tax=Paenibacillus alkaliterrae TaxID=320909 RepID=UPI001F4261B0|nr:extracellular solute-binding protein [Paenibacillus alkaliterrae]MCF2938540.1 extracellular solute-binding protein [Paenibacillus alkaliterrae]
MSKTKSKTIAFVTCVLLVFAVIAGCGGSGGNNQPAAMNNTAEAGGEQTSGNSNSDTSAEKTTITLMVGNTGTTLEALKVVAAEAEKKLNIAIEWDIKPDGTEGDNLVKTRLATDDMADLLVYNSGSLLQALNPEENFLDLTNESYMANILDSFKETVTSGGKVFGVPVGSTNAGAILYNKKIYADLGLTVPQTWKEFMANNEKIKAAGKTAVIGTYKDTWTSQLFVLADYYNVQQQVPNFAEDYTGNKAKYAATPAALRGFEKIEEVFKAGYMNKDFLATTYDAGLKMLAEGTGVHYPMLSSALDAINQNYPDKMNDIGVFAQPSDSADTNGLTVWMPSGLYINKNGKKADAAKKWVEYFVSPEGQAVLSGTLKAVGPYVIKDVALPEDTYQGVKEMQSYFDEGKTAPALEFVSPVKGPNLENITVAVGSGISGAKKGAEDYDKDVEKQAQQLNLPGW